MTVFNPHQILPSASLAIKMAAPTTDLTGPESDDESTSTVRDEFGLPAPSMSEFAPAPSETEYTVSQTFGMQKIQLDP